MTLDVVNRGETGIFICLRRIAVLLGRDVLESLDYAGCMLTEIVSVVTAFLDDDHFGADLE